MICAQAHTRHAIGGPRRTIRVLLALVALVVAASVARAAQETGAGADSTATHHWDVELGGGILFYEPSVEDIPAGSADMAIDALIEASVGRVLSERLTLRLSGGWAQGTTTQWQSRSGEGTASIPTPSIGNGFLTLETPLVRWRITPFAGVGGGFLSFGSVDEMITFRWTSAEEEQVHFQLDSHTDGALLFELGATAAIGSSGAAVLRYRLLSVFSGDQVDTLDRLTLSARIYF